MANVEVLKKTDLPAEVVQWVGESERCHMYSSDSGVVILRVAMR